MKRIFTILMLSVLFGLYGCEKRETTRNYQSTSWPLKNHQGTILETPHYRIYTTIKDKDLHAAAVNLAEGQYERFCQALMIRPKEKMTVYIFSDVQQWTAFTESKFGRRAQDYLRIRNGGYTAKNFAAFYYIGRYSTLTILAHELFHLYVNLASCPEPVPAWLNEGMACYFEAHEWNGFSPIFTPKKNLFRRENLSEAVGKNKLFSLKDILATHAGEISKLPQPRVLTYYAQLWAILEFLNDPNSGQYHVNFQNLSGELGTRKMAMRAKGYLTTVREDEKVSFGEAVFRQYITNDLKQFDTDFNNYLPTLIGWK
ncbi:MAG: hypothetical protein WC975_00955 [Phycisphaerae bacterium]